MLRPLPPHPLDQLPPAEVTCLVSLPLTSSESRQMQPSLLVCRTSPLFVRIMNPTSQLITKVGEENCVRKNDRTVRMRTTEQCVQGRQNRARKNDRTACKDDNHTHMRMMELRT